MKNNKENKLTIIDLFKMLFSQNRERYEEIDFGITKRIRLTEKFPFLKKIAKDVPLAATINIGSLMLAITIIIVFFIPLILLSTPEKYFWYLNLYGYLFILQGIKFLTILFDPEWHFVRLADLYLFLSRIAIIIIIIILIGPNHSILGLVDNIVDNIAENIAICISQLITKLFGGM
jgi:hypothetical protein